MSLAKTVLVVGGSGFVGSHIVARLREHYKVYATYRSHPFKMQGVGFFPMALEDRVWTKKLIRFIAPQVIIYCAGKNDRAWVEANPNDADNVHASGVSTVAEACAILQSRVIYLSNPYSFDGKRGNYHESDIALPFTEFGKLKLAGENYLRSRSLNWITLRSSPLYGRGVPGNPSFLDTLRIRLDRGQNIELTTREIHSYAPIQGLTEAVAALIESSLKNKVIHYSGLTKLSPYDLAVQFAREFGWKESLITAPGGEKGDISDYSLNCTHLVETFKIKPTLLEDGLRLLKA